MLLVETCSGPVFLFLLFLTYSCLVPCLRCIEDLSKNITLLKCIYFRILIVFLTYLLRNRAFSLFKSCFFLAVEIEYFSNLKRRCRLLVEKSRLFSSRIRRFVFLGLRSRSLLTTLVALLEILEGRPSLGLERVVEVFFFLLNTL